MTNEERYFQQVVIELPDSQKDKTRRIADGLSPCVCLDPCIVDEIQTLWDLGIQTTGCCCGHNNPEWFPFVNVNDDSIEAMLDLGYIQKHSDTKRKDTFLLKSA
ncbi:hypothetical protein J3L18_00030 [Mucilaginibacter gossypii]|uniref:hypothetical protein n=1 Tax=Mucilaginibacter gossypii TaxID=551996 RepID=UPI00101A6C89|nr:MULTISPECIES: hypothetical protein [Mucilaginibacter]QTE37490.1 hypothetical protein J3L18_00030 [Mucilaginibacter gossypii]